MPMLKKVHSTNNPQLSSVFKDKKVKQKRQQEDVNQHYIHPPQKGMDRVDEESISNASSKFDPL